MGGELDMVLDSVESPAGEKCDPGNHYFLASTNYDSNDAGFNSAVQYLSQGHFICSVDGKEMAMKASDFGVTYGLYEAPVPHMEKSEPTQTASAAESFGSYLELSLIHI